MTNEKVESRKLSPEAKQAAVKVGCTVGHATYFAWCEGYDAATANLREELERWQRIARQRASDRNQAQDKMVDLREQLAHQQPSPPSEGLAVASAPTPDVESKNERD